MVGQSEVPKPKVFISYSRRDSSWLAEELATGLDLIGFDAFLDRMDIAAGEDWGRRLASLIQSSDTVVFILSPESIKSERCIWEVARATELSKRMIPVIGSPIVDSAVPEPLRRLNYIFFTIGQSFTKSLGELADALRVDLDWLREHTRLAELAARWDQRQRTEALLLRGLELQQAQAWMREGRPGAPECTDLQRAFIGASSVAERALANKERQQLEAMAKAQATQAEALSEREIALRKLRLRTWIGVLLVFLVATAGGIASFMAKERAVEDAIEKEAKRTDIKGQLVAYAASPGQLAQDGFDGGKNSPYTRFLLDELENKSASLQIALAKANRKVLEKTNNQQRPFLASDLGGDIYLKRAPPERSCQALLVWVDSFGKGINAPQMVNVENDAVEWDRFLRGQKCATRRLNNPESNEVLAAVREINFPTGDSESIAAGMQRGTLKPNFAPSNTFVVFFFAGAGLESGGQQYLIAANTEYTKKGIETTAIKVSALQALIREKADASVLILDTNFFPHYVK